MATFAVIKDGIVENCIVADSKEIAEKITGLTCIESDIAHIGFPYIDGNFVLPPSPEDLETISTHEIENTVSE
jgi:hypothetical protein